MGMMRRKYKALLVVFVMLLGIMLIFSALFPSEVMTSKWVMLGGQQKNVAASLYNLEKWQEWNVLLVGKSGINVKQKDSVIKPGDMISWQSNPNGTVGSIELTAVQKDGISMEIINPGELPIQSGFSLTQRDDSVQVVWFIVERLRWYPWEKIYGMMASDMKGPALQHSLDKFKEQAEQQ